MEGYHRSVLLKEVIEVLSVKKGGWYLDCTLGDGGHSLEILRLGGNIVGLDVDPQALERVIKRFKEESITENRFKLIRGNFRELKNSIETQAELANQKFMGVIFDLGVSTLQLMDPERGFSFAKVGPLDMRMDPNLGIKALDLVNALPRKELYELFKTLGEEKYSWSLANALVRAREIRTDSRFAVSTTKELADLVDRVIGRRRGEIHPATRVFQALRIAVNDELGALQEGLDQARELVEKEGRILVISFHSLEDRIVKFTFREWEEKGLGQILTKKPIIPTDNEVSQNVRSRSAKMRVFKL